VFSCTTQRSNCQRIKRKHNERVVKLFVSPPPLLLFALSQLLISSNEKATAIISATNYNHNHNHDHNHNHNSDNDNDNDNDNNTMSVPSTATIEVSVPSIPVATLVTAVVVASAPPPDNDHDIIIQALLPVLHNQHQMTANTIHNQEQHAANQQWQTDRILDMISCLHNRILSLESTVEENRNEARADVSNLNVQINNLTKGVEKLLRHTGISDDEQIQGCD
jgi:hypothetical protein